MKLQFFEVDIFWKKNHFNFQNRQIHLKVIIPNYFFQKWFSDVEFRPINCGQITHSKILLRNKQLIQLIVENT